MVCLGFKFWAWSLIFPHQTLLYSDDTIHIKQLYAVTKKYPTNRLTILFLDLLQVLKKSTTTPCSAIGMAPSLLNRTLKWCQSPINDISGIDWITILEDLGGSNDIGIVHPHTYTYNFGGEIPMKWFDQCNYRSIFGGGKEDSRGIKMSKPLSTVATLGLLKILLILFNTLFWVSNYVVGIYVMSVIIFLQ